MTAAISLEDLRREAGGRYLPLRSGLTHVVVEGQEEEPTVLLVHGATVPHWEFDRLVPHLRKAGCRTVRFDLFGHGLSDRPAAVHNHALFLEQTLGVLDAIRASRPLTVIGHSFGASIAAAVAAQRPESVGRLVLVAPLFDYMTGSWLPQIFGLPGLGRPLMRQIGLPLLKRRRQRRYAEIGANHLTPRYIAEASAPGYAESLSSMFACRVLGDQSRHYQNLQQGKCDILVVAGGADRVVPLRDVARVRSLLPDHSYLELIGAEHNLLLTHPERVAAAIGGASR